MNEGLLNSRIVLLASGEQLPLAEVAMGMSLLEDLCHGGAAGRAALVLLRQSCLTGIPLSDEAFQRIPPEERLFLLDGSGRRPNGLVSTMIRAALRGENEDVHLVNPFTDKRDRVMADLMNGSMKASLFLSTEQIGQLLFADDDLGPWTRRAKKSSGPGRGDAPPSKN